MTRPKWFMPVAIVALLWNLMGCAAYLMDVMLTPEAIAAMSPDQRALYAARPIWAVALYAIAVWGGALGCVGLVMKKRWAKGPLLASLLGLIGQDIALFGMSPVAIPASAYALQGAVLVIAVLLLLLANRAAREGWLS
ncbi:MAG: hypothetical protein IPK33_08655 [Gemmatimonadetes bacterium]|jgi:hypothetical protein|nr:hypothetical protein [Gemmatimonadota bacterium]MBK8057934.1 hypothetical protein [Gemmatimonadota bacterium]MBK9410950.1 hypothetical protein [Gemmatimonadota bacterium]HNV76681.1 hypothetical protein [Gemmatimonadaceae bacterium]